MLLGEDLSRDDRHRRSYVDVVLVVEEDDAEDRKPRDPMTVFVQGTESVPAPVELNERPGTYGVIKLAK